MEIKGKIHCFFEQSGTFKNEFKKLGYAAEDYDIQNNFGETDHVGDLFAEIERGYNDEPSIFDNITTDDLIIAFFPCIYFCERSQIAFKFSNNNYRGKSDIEKLEAILTREENRHYFYTLLLKLCGVAIFKGLRLIIENPYSKVGFLYDNFIIPPAIIDKDRTRRGDFFKKPTQYWFIGCEPTHGFTFQQDKERKVISKCKQGARAGICSEERSMISPDYARNFICDFVIGKEQKIGVGNLFKLV